MGLKKMVLRIALLLMAGILLISFQIAGKSKADGIVSCSADAGSFHDAAAVNSLLKQKPRLITIENFHANKLNNDRSIYVYLPPSYYKYQSKAYPVLYVQDGKGVFYESDWSKESLNLHMKSDELVSKGKIEEIVIVGISNMGDQRSSEYTHWDGFDRVFVKGNGALYEDFALNDVKPFLEENFRINSGRENTAIMGASLGGFVSFNIGMRNPEVFSRIAVQSPFLGWGKEQLLDKIRKGEYNAKRDLKLWMDMGSAESDFLAVMREVVKELLAQGCKPIAELAVFEVPGGEHREGSWAKRAEDILIYFYGNTGKPSQLELDASGKVSLLEQTYGAYKHINPIVTYESGMRTTDLTGSYTVSDPNIAEVDSFGNIEAKKEGTVNVTYRTLSGLSETIAIKIER